MERRRTKKRMRTEKIRKLKKRTEKIRGFMGERGLKSRIKLVF